MIQDLKREIAEWMFGALDNFPWVGGKHGDREVFAPGLPEGGFGKVAVGL